MKVITGRWANAGLGSVKLQLTKYSLIGATTDNAPRFYTIKLNASGAIPDDFKIWANDELLPEGTAYIAKIFDAHGFLLFAPQRFIICGPSPIDLTKINVFSIA